MLRTKVMIPVGTTVKVVSDTHPLNGVKGCVVGHPVFLDYEKYYTVQFDNFESLLSVKDLEPTKK